MRRMIYPLAHFFFLFLGLLKFLLTGANDVRAHRALVYFFCITGGRFNDWCSNLISCGHKPLPLHTRTGVLGDMGGAQCDTVVAQLNEKGYATFTRALPSETCVRLMQFALNTKARVRAMDGEINAEAMNLALFDGVRPKAVRYDYLPKDLLANPEIQSLLADESILAVAEKYLNARPRADVLSMWWHTHFHSKPDSNAAQFYHFDLDRLKWLKVFVYLTDVGLQDGPHSFIEGSHRQGGIPQCFLSRGYVRLSDEEVIQHYGVEKEIQFAAPRGTIIIEDTRGLHKGSPVFGNSRLVLQLQLSNSLLGAVYPIVKFPAKRTPELDNLLRKAPDIYRGFY